MRTRSLAFAVAGALLTSGLAGAIIIPGPQPTHMLGPANPVSFCDGSVMPGDPSCLPGMITFDAANNVAGLNFGSATCNGKSGFSVNTFGSPQVFGFGRNKTAELTVTQWDTTYDPAHPRPIAVNFADRSGKGVGTMQLIAPHGDHVYTQMHLMSTGGLAGVVDMTLDVQTLDIDGDGYPDFATLSDLAPLQFGGLDCILPGNQPASFHKIYVPVAKQPDGNTAIILDLDGNGTPDPPANWGPPLSKAAILQVPTLSNLGLALLALVLLVVGVRLARLVG